MSSSYIFSKTSYSIFDDKKKPRSYTESLEITKEGKTIDGVFKTKKNEEKEKVKKFKSIKALANVLKIQEKNKQY